MKKALYLSSLAIAIFVRQSLLPAQTAPAPHPQTPPAAHKTKATAAAAKAGGAVWTPDVQQYLGVQQSSFTLVGLNHLSKAQLDALVSSAKNNLYGDPRRHVLTCGPATGAAPGTVRVLLTVSGDDASGQRSTEIRQAIGAIDGVQIVDAAASADRALHVVIQEQTLGKRTIGYTASYMTATPCTDDSRKVDAELKGQLGTYTDPKGVDLATDLARMLGQDLQSLRSR